MMRQPFRLQRTARFLTLAPLAGLALLMGHAGEPTSPGEPLEESSRAMARAVALVDSAQRFDRDRNVPAALADWREAYELSQDPTLLLEVARLERQVGNSARATFALEQFLEHAAVRVSPALTRVATRKLEAVRPSTARLELATNVQGASVELEAERGVVTGSGFSVQVLLDAGERKLSLSKPGYETRTLNLSLDPGEVRTLRVALDKAVSGRSQSSSDRARLASAPRSPQAPAL